MSKHSPHKFLLIPFSSLTLNLRKSNIKYITNDTKKFGTKSHYSAGFRNCRTFESPSVSNAYLSLWKLSFKTKANEIAHNKYENDNPISPPTVNILHLIYLALSPLHEYFMSCYSLCPYHSKRLTSLCVCASHIKRKNEMKFGTSRWKGGTT